METARTSALAPFFGHAAGWFAGVGSGMLGAAGRARPSQALGDPVPRPRWNSLHVCTKSLSNHQKVTGNEPPAALGLLCFNILIFFPLPHAAVGRRGLLPPPALQTHSAKGVFGGEGRGGWIDSPMAVPGAL